MPLSSDAAAISSLMPSGSFTSRSAGDIVGFGIGADGAAAIADAVAHLEAGDALAQRLHHAGRFRAQAGRQRQRIKPGAVIGVDEIDADGGVPDPHLARPGAGRS